MTPAGGAGARRFGEVAALYDAVRPDYPAATVAFLVGDAHRVLDLGAGTGKLARAVASLGREVVAVDPDARMLDILGERLDVERHVGTAERIPLADASVDAVVVGQAWHWVDEPVAVREVARVLRPGGTLGVVWNTRDESVPWVRELGRVFGDGVAPPTRVAAPELGGVLTTPEHRAERWTLPMSVDDLVALAATRSYVVEAGEERRAQVAAAVRRLAATVAPRSATDPRVDLPYVTEAFVARRR
ncbi:class I SAM-dependent methyltransferase [Flavimobilis sp. GY10621]|uniref:Class I SAM-dependent methyltransferase n=1 Tax=Flavimobilis rhizosphaerae TaxID=2775421 RepID=A0ABR9DTA3_9MICO|nr:class I SAM-dependent methyltransferase [Flavimobilis rhizosphaerae]MBD9700306.1 class I SAM-dependent methyltransferase [Flavimobilis rhizosphaerae]